MSHKNDIISRLQLTCYPKVIIIPRLYVSSCLSVVKDVLMWLNAVKRGKTRLIRRLVKKYTRTKRATSIAKYRLPRIKIHSDGLSIAQILA